ncbi:MAG: sulfite:cytochrome C oxidoreductase subunit B [Campylobacterales bacterium]|nr:sulfite:cytochrome C oxidoreductase subunit B [Campylobacterales bacterium]
MYKSILLAMLGAVALNAADVREIREDIEIPYISYDIKMGEHFDAVQTNCLTCHSFGYVTNQGPQSKEQWRKKVEKMVVHFKAPITDADSADITEYLFKHYGNGQEK